MAKAPGRLLEAERGLLGGSTTNALRDSIGNEVHAPASALHALLEAQVQPFEDALVVGVPVLQVPLQTRADLDRKSVV